MNPTFAERIRRGEQLIGALLSLPCPELAEGLLDCGFDWVWIDLEHSALSLREAQQLLIAARGRAPALVRIPANDPVWIKQVLDLGPDGIIVPQVQTAAEAERALAAAKYPPRGTRSVGVGRAHGFGTRFAEYVEQANARTAVLAQIEHVHALEGLGEMLELPGLDGLIVGPYDLSGSLGLLGQVTHPQVQAAVARVKAACDRRQMPLGIFTFSPAEARKYLAEGFRLVALGLDATYLVTAAKRALEEAKAK
jgi:2-dehydro-3-deoxyglucarate aldolase/4-hydroxy-2-oxoheptanedioate aldolase